MLKPRSYVVGNLNNEVHGKLLRCLQRFKEKLDFSNKNVVDYIKAVIAVLESEIKPTEKELPNIKGISSPLSERVALQVFGHIEEWHSTAPIDPNVQAILRTDYRLVNLLDYENWQHYSSFKISGFAAHSIWEGLKKKLGENLVFWGFPSDAFRTLEPSLSSLTDSAFRADPWVQDLYQVLEQKHRAEAKALAREILKNQDQDLLSDAIIIHPVSGLEFLVRALPSKQELRVERYSRAISSFADQPVDRDGD